MSEMTERVHVTFAALDSYVERHMVAPTEVLLTGRNRVEWGPGDAFPDYLLELSRTVPSLRSVIKGTVDFIAGDGAEILPLNPYAAAGVMNTKGDRITDQVRALARDYETFGGFVLQIIRGADGAPVEVYQIPVRYLRTNKENTVFYYSESWTGGGRRKILEYPSFYPFTPERWMRISDAERDRHAASILLVKADAEQVYPLPPYVAALKACEVERCIDDYHLNAINNGFTSSMIVNFNNGVPSDEVKEEIERAFSRKFSGHQNAGRIMFSWNSDKDNATTITEPKVEDFGDRYNALAKHCRQQVFTAFRANPNLFGIPTESLGFSSEEYESAFKLYNRTAVRPVQRLICDTYDRIYGEEGVLTIKPFSLEESVTDTNVR